MTARDSNGLTARDRRETLYRAVRTLAVSLASGKKEGWEQLHPLATGPSRKTFATACNRSSLLSGAALTGRSDMVTWLLEAGVDPNYYAGYGVEPRQWSDFPLHVVSAAPQTEATLRCLELLLRAGASIAQVSPPEDLVRTKRWRHSALDVAIRAGRPAAFEALLPHADSTTCEAALVTTIVATTEPKADRPWLLSLLQRLPVAPASTRHGIHPLHAAAIIGDLEVWAIVAARTEDPNPRVQVEQSYGEGGIPNISDGWPSVGLRAGATPLDVVDVMRGLVRSGLTRLVDAWSVRAPAEWEPAKHARLTATLATYDELARRIHAGGGVQGDITLPPAVAEAERELSRLAEALGMLDRWRIAVAAVDLAEKGPLGFLVMVSEPAREVFAGLRRPDAHLLGAFLTGRLPETVLLGPDFGPRERAEIPANKLVWPKDYPPAAAPLFALAMRYPSALLGYDGETVLGATLEEEGTMLWRVTRKRVDKIGEVRAWIREGVDVLLADVASAP